MKRLIEDSLLEWKNRDGKMPLIVFGARQTGKTTTIYEFGKAHYSNIAVFNFEASEKLAAIFEGDLNPSRIVNDLEIFSGQSINQGTLVFFDEVQHCPKALTSLKYFSERAPGYNVIAAGSLLGVAVNRRETGKNGNTMAEENGVSFPVGKVEILTMYPMNFEEFLQAANPYLLNTIKECYESNLPLSETSHDKALELYRSYLFTGGMPRVVADYLEKKDADFVRIKQNEILVLYTADMAKYTTAAEQVKIAAIYDSIPSQLAKENRKFQYAIVGSGVRAASYETGLDWLKNAGLVLKCDKTREGKISLKSYVDMLSYKVYFSDVGLLNAKAAVPRNVLLTGSGYGGETKGAMTENYVAQELVFNGHPLYYWESNGRAEMDFLLQSSEGVIPVEVKAAENVQSKSLKEFIKRYAPPYSIRVSARNFGFENNIKSVPLYAVFCIKP